MQFQDRAYGTVVVDDPCAMAIIESPAFDRLWRIKQNGPFSVADPRWVTSRAEHSIGVYHLLRMFGASREEQLAGLVHDVNHVAFSHLIDWLVGDAATQEEHAGFIDKNPHLEAIKNLLTKFDVDSEAIMDYARHSLLEQPSTELCADRIDYTFRDALCMQQLSKNDVDQFIGALTTSNKQFVMTDADLAERFARLSIELHIIRESNWGNAVYETICRVLRRAIRAGKLKNTDFLIDDDHIYGIMHELKDPLAELFFAWEQAGAPIERGTPQDHHLQTWSKIRFIDPLVKTINATEHISVLRPGIATLIKHYQLLRGNEMYMKYPEKFAELARLE